MSGGRSGRNRTEASVGREEVVAWTLSAVGAAELELVRWWGEAGGLGGLVARCRGWQKNERGS